MIYPQVRPSAEKCPMSFGMDTLRLVFGVSAEGAHHALRDCHDTGAPQTRLKSLCAPQTGLMHVQADCSASTVRFVGAIVLMLLRATIDYCSRERIVL